MQGVIDEQASNNHCKLFGLVCVGDIDGVLSLLDDIYKSPPCSLELACREPQHELYFNNLVKLLYKDAIYYGHLSIVRALTEKFKIDYCTEKKHTLLCDALWSKNTISDRLKMIKYIILTIGVDKLGDFEFSTALYRAQSELKTHKQCDGESAVEQDLENLVSFLSSFIPN